MIIIEYVLLSVVFFSTCYPTTFKNDAVSVFFWFVFLFCVCVCVIQEDFVILIISA